MSPFLARLSYEAIGQIQSVAARLANLGRSVPRDYRRYDVSKLLRTQRLASRLNDGDEVLDVGCGDGQLLRDLVLFRKLGRRVGIDLRLPESEPGLEFAVYDGKHLPFRDRSFDVVVCAYFLHYLTRDHAVSLLGEAARVARRGIFVFEDSRPAWSFWYRMRNRLERIRSDILYRANSGGKYESSGTEEMYLIHQDWAALLSQLPLAASVEVEPLDRLSGLVHHTLFEVRLQEGGF